MKSGGRGAAGAVPLISESAEVLGTNLPHHSLLFPGRGILRSRKQWSNNSENGGRD